MKHFLGDLLFVDPVGEDQDFLPSPEDLKKKILVKAKKLPPGNAPRTDPEGCSQKGL